MGRNPLIAVDGYSENQPLDVQARLPCIRLPGLNQLQLSLLMTIQHVARGNLARWKHANHADPSPPQLAPHTPPP